MKVSKYKALLKRELVAGYKNAFKFWRERVIRIANTGNTTSI